MLQNVAVIIRSAGERTEALCEYLVKQQVDPQNVVVIHEKPFSQALLRSFEIGIDYSLDWTLCVDADLLIKSHTVELLLEKINTYPENVLGGHGRILDKMYGKTKYAGLHLYRTSLLPEAINYIPDAQVSLRPESYTKKAMITNGHNWVQFSDIVGIHDFEQFYGDIYRTMIVRAHKSKDTVNYLLNRADKLSQSDKDFLICACALRIALSRNDAIQLHSEQWREESNFLLTALGLSEKAAFHLEGKVTLPDKIIRRFMLRGQAQRIMAKTLSLYKQYVK